MTTIAALRENHLNRHLGITDDGAALPWPSDDRDRALQDALRQTWPDLGVRAQGTVSTDGTTDVVTVPAAFQQDAGLISRIDLVYSSGGVTRRVGKVTGWTWIDADTIQVTPPLETLSGLSLRFTGFSSFAISGSDLPSRLEPAIAYRAAGILYGDLAGQLANSERQQGLDRGAIVDYPTAVGLSAYWERRYFEAIERDPAKTYVGPRRARR